MSLQDGDVTIVLPNNSLLVARNRVLSTLCGVRVHKDVLDAAILVQGGIRVFLARRKAFQERKEKRERKNAFENIWRRTRARKEEGGAVRIQSAWRGWRERDTPLGKSITRLLDYQKEMVQYEVALLGMSRLTGLRREMMERD